MNESKTTAAVEPGNFTGAPKEFGRDKDADAIFSLKRGTLRNLHAQGKIRGVLLRVCGQKSGVRLWDMASIREFIRREMDAEKEAQ
jgi:hypothetical protein